jgi:hypothetical protein
VSTFKPPFKPTVIVGYHGDGLDTLLNNCRRRANFLGWPLEWIVNFSKKVRDAAYYDEAINLIKEHFEVGDA